MMRTFSLFTTDTRYSVPTLSIVVVDDEQRAIALARANLDQSNFHRAVELRDGDRPIFQRLKVADATVG
jgi:methylase of polypeptide subunit release factors